MTKPADTSFGFSPVRRAQAGGPVRLPRVTVPRLEELVITVPPPATVTEEDVRRRFLELAREHAGARYRSFSEKVAAGDEVLMDVIGYSRGRLIPFSLRADTWQLVEPDPLLPGFYERFIGQPIRHTFTIPLTLPEGYPVQALRGAPCQFVVELKAARVVQPPDLEDPRLLQVLGRGETRVEVLRFLRDELREKEAVMHDLATTLRVLDVLAERTEVHIPESLVDEEVQRRWARAEGKVLQEKGFSNTEQQESLDGWLGEARLRRDAERRLRISLALGAVCARDEQVLTPALLKKLITEVSGSLGVNAEEALHALEHAPAAARVIEQAAWHLMAVDYVMGRVTVRPEPAAR